MAHFLQRLLASGRAGGSADPPGMTLQLADGTSTQVQCLRHPRARRMRLSVNERGVRLTLPPRASLRAADAFVHAHRDWIATQLRRAVASAALVRLDEGTIGLPLRGQVLPLRRECARHAYLAHTGEVIVLALPAHAGPAVLRRAMHEFYLAQARADIGRWLPRYLPDLPRAPRTLRIRPLSSLWGSLSASDALSLDLALVLGTPAAFEYVLVHELCHLIHRHHQRAFWREVEARGQDWRAQRDYLRAQGTHLKAQLRQLLAP